jgi:hypothetical protein
MRIFNLYPILIQMLSPTQITYEMLAIKDVANSSRKIWYSQLVLNQFARYVIKYIDNNFVPPYVEIVLAYRTK